MKQNRVQPSENVYSSLFNIIPLSLSSQSSSSSSSSSSSFSLSSLSPDDQIKHNELALEILLLMKDDKRPPFSIFEGLVNREMSKTEDVEYSKEAAESEFRPFLGIFESNSYRADVFFIDTFVETLATKLGKRKSAMRFLTLLVDRATETGEKCIFLSFFLSSFLFFFSSFFFLAFLFSFSLSFIEYVVGCTPAPPSRL